MAEFLVRDGISATVSRVVQAANVVVVVLSPLLLIAWAVGPSRRWLEARGVFDEGTLVALLGLVVSLTLANFHHLLKRTERVDQALADMAKSRSGVIVQGVNNVYPELLGELESLPERCRSVDILGLTLFTAWNHLQGFLQDPRASHWTVRLQCVSPDFAAANVPGIPDDWADEARVQVAKIRRFMDDRKADLVARKVSLSLCEYHAFPAVHGFMLGNGALYISFTHWEPGGGQLAKPYHPYEKIDATDHSHRAEIYRDLFSNWFDNASATSRATPPATPG